MSFCVNKKGIKKIAELKTFFFLKNKNKTSFNVTTLAIFYLNFKAIGASINWGDDQTGKQAYQTFWPHFVQNMSY